MAKAKGISLHVGVNSLDPKHYAGWKGELKCAEQDAVVRAVHQNPLGSGCARQLSLLSPGVGQGQECFAVEYSFCHGEHNALFFIEMFP